MTPSLSGSRVLVVEDEFFLAIELEELLTSVGAEVVGPVPDISGALNLVQGDGLDLAILDINLGGDLAYPIADALAAQGVPFIFTSAYMASEIPARYAGRRHFEKPYGLSRLVKALAELAPPRP